MQMRKGLALGKHTSAHNVSILEISMSVRRLMLSDCLEYNNKPPPYFSRVSQRSLRKTLKPFIDI